jgi:hypothetical protein
VEYFFTSAQLTRSFVIAFWKPASSFAGYLLTGEYEESKKKSQSVISVGTVVGQHCIVTFFHGAIQSIEGCLDLNMTILEKW